MPAHKIPPPSADMILRDAIAALLERPTYDVVGGALLEQADIRRIIFHEEYEAFRQALPDRPHWGAEEVQRIGDAICNLVKCHRGFLCDPEVSRWIERFAEDHFSFAGLQREERPGEEPGTRLLGAWEEAGRSLRKGKDLTDTDRGAFDRWTRSILKFFQDLSKAVSGALSGDQRKEQNRQRALIFAWGRLLGYSYASLERAIAEWDKSVGAPKTIETWRQDEENRHLIERYAELVEPYFRKTRPEGPETPKDDSSDVEILPE